MKGELTLKYDWLELAQQLQSISQAGLAYSKDAFDIERFDQLRGISRDIISNHSNLSEQDLKLTFTNERGYPTPKVDVRSVVFKENKILMVKEKMDGLWALPGGWADIGVSPSENALKETKEESGFTVKPIKVIAVLDRSQHSHPPSIHHIYKIFFLCEIVGGEAAAGIETDSVDFFAENDLPPLSVARNTLEQIKMVFQFQTGDRTETVFD